jgi:hypothetical protein
MRHIVGNRRNFINIVSFIASGIGLDVVGLHHGQWGIAMKTKHKILSLSIIVLTHLTLIAAEPATVIDAAKFKNLQEALDAVPAGGALVKLPPGKFELTEPLHVHTEDTRLEGAGTATHLVNKNEKGEPALLLRAKDYAKSKKMLWRIQLGNFRISGNPKSGDGLLAEGINEIFIQGVSVDHNGGHGINLVHCTEDPRVSDNLLTYNADAGLNIQAGHDIVVNANQFEENQDGLRCVNSFNLTMNGNNLDDHLRHGVVIENTYGSVLSGNMIEECNGTAIILDRDCYGITISANVIAHELGGGVDLRDAWGCAVSANTFTIVHQFGVRVGKDSGRIAITGNAFCNSHIGNGVRRVEGKGKTLWHNDEGTGVVLNETKSVVITGNTFTGMSREGVKSTGKCERIIVLGNIFHDLSRRSDKKLPAVDLPGALNTIVKDNLKPPGH